MGKPAEILLFEYLAESQAAAGPDDVIYAIELHDTVWQAITKPRGIRISDAVGDLVPTGGGVLKEWDVMLEIVCFAKVEGKDKKQRQEALAAVFDIQETVCGLLYADESLGMRVCTVQILKCARGYDVFDGNPYAVANVGIVVNPSG